jgi:hypothetical protein
MISSKVSIKNMVQIIRSPQHKSLVAKVSLFAFVIEIVSIVINRTLLVKHLLASLLLSEVSAVLFFGLLGLAGLIVIVRRELPQVIVVHGRLAVVNGFIWCIISWILMLRYIYALAIDILRLI